MTVSSPLATTALEELRRATAASHAQLERGLAIAREDASTDVYLCHLRALWGWLAPLERHLGSLLLPSDFQADLRLVKTGWLTEDLDAAGVGEGERPWLAATDSPLGEDSSLASVLGAAYVVEGAQLGGAVLARRFATRLLAPRLETLTATPPAPWPLRYLTGYGPATPTLWRSFLACLECHVSTPGARAAAARAAQRQFERLDAWFAAAGAQVQAPSSEALALAQRRRS